MPENAPDPKTAQGKSFWATLPGLLTAVGGLIAAIATLLTAFVGVGLIGPGKTSSAPSPAALPSFTAAATPAAEAPPGGARTSTPSQVARDTPIPTQASTTATAPPGGILFEEDFSSERNNWLVKVLPEAEKGYEAGEYRIAVFQADHSSWAYPQPSLELSDFVLEVDARRASGSASNEFGVLARYQDATDDFYAFVISTDGTFRVQSYVEDEWVDLVGWTASGAILGGEAVNRLRVTCQGDEMRFFANGQLLAQVNDAALGAGNIGLLASAFDERGVTVAFDNLRVRALTAP